VEDDEEEADETINFEYQEKIPAKWTQKDVVR